MVKSLGFNEASISNDLDLPNGLILDKKLPTDDDTLPIQLNRSLNLSITHWIGVNSIFNPSITTSTNPLIKGPAALIISPITDTIASNTGFKMLLQTPEIAWKATLNNSANSYRS